MIHKPPNPPPTGSRPSPPPRYPSGDPKKPANKFPAGRHNLMITAAVNYCLGRSTYITGDCADWLIEIWPALDDRTRNIIQRDIDKAFARDDEDRESGREYKALGDDCDRQQWERVRRLWKTPATQEKEQR